MRDARKTHRDLVVYCLTVVTTLVAAIAIFWNGRSVYRRLLFGQSPATTAELVIIALSVVVIQIAYWTILIRKPPFQLTKSPVLGTIVLFFSRISFLLASALFSIVVFVRFEELHIRPGGYLLLAAVLFTLFCFSKWLETIGRQLENGPNKSDRETSEQGP